MRELFRVIWCTSTRFSVNEAIATITGFEGDTEKCPGRGICGSFFSGSLALSLSCPLALKTALKSHEMTPFSFKMKIENKMTSSF